MRKGIVATILFSILILTAGGLANSALAAHGTGEHPPGGGVPLGPQSGLEFLNIVEAITDWLFVLLLLTATIFIILAALQFLTGGGDSAKISEARQKLLYAVIAVIVAAFAKGAPVVIKAIVGV